MAPMARIAAESNIMERVGSVIWTSIELSRMLFVYEDETLTDDPWAERWMAVVRRWNER